MDEVEYEWNDKAEKDLQKQFNHWLNCYGLKEDCVLVPAKIASDFWRDLFTDVVKTIHPRVKRAIEEDRRQHELEIKELEDKKGEMLAYFNKVLLEKDNRLAQAEKKIKILEKQKIKNGRT